MLIAAFILIKLPKVAISVLPFDNLYYKSDRSSSCYEQSFLDVLEKIIQKCIYLPIYHMLTFYCLHFSKKKTPCFLHFSKAKLSISLHFSKIKTCFFLHFISSPITKGWIPNQESSPLTYYNLPLYSLWQPMVSVIAPFVARLSPQAFVFGSCLLLVYHIKVADAFLVETFSVYAACYKTSATEGLKLYHIYFWSYIVLLHFFVAVIWVLSDYYLLSVHYIHSLWQSLQTATAAHHLSVHVEHALYAALI